jgi:hypothetical protein
MTRPSSSARNQALMNKLCILATVAIALIALCDTVPAAEAESIAIFDSDVAPGTWVVTLPAEPLCTTPEAADSYYRMSIDEHPRIQLPSA